MRILSGKPISARVAASLPGGVLVLLISGAVTFGAVMAATGSGPFAGEPAGAASEPEASPEMEKQKPSEPNLSPKPTVRDEPAEGKEPIAEEPKPEEPTAEEPKPEEPKPEEPKPQPSGLVLEAWVKEGVVKLHWSAYLGDGQGAYKIVRSADAVISFPPGADDTAVGVIDDTAVTYLADAAPCGVEWHYAVFAVQHTETGWVALALSNVAAAWVECHDPKAKPPSPDPEPPYVMAFEVATDGGAAILHWEQCSSDGFVAYKVVRSMVHQNPTFPLTDGTEVVAVIGSAEVTTFVDHGVAIGETWTYRVVSVGQGQDGWKILGQTPAQSVVIAD